jgi:hypothetical protein
MIATLESSSADALIKLLGMTGSTFAAEAGTAAQKANALIHALGLRWDDVITAPKQYSPAQYKPRQTNNTNDWRAMWRYCMHRSDLLRARDRRFVDGISDWQGDLTSKQFDLLKDIYARAKRAA